jgi:hypothetical protein
LWMLFCTFSLLVERKERTILQQSIKMANRTKLVAKTAALLLFFCCVLCTVEGRRVNGDTTFDVKEGLPPVGTSGPDSPTSPYGTMTLIA